MSGNGRTEIEDSEGRITVTLTGFVGICIDDRPAPIRGPKQIALLARLALETGQVVTRDALLHDLWEGHRLASGSGALRVQVNRLRKVLEEAGAPGLIATESTGYRLDLPPSSVDVFAAEAMADEARSLSNNDAAEASRRYEQAAACISGPMLVGLEDFSFAMAAKAAYAPMLATAQREWAMSMAESGERVRAIALLEALVDLDPLDTAAVAQLMAAHRSDGRPHLSLRVGASYREATRRAGLLVAETVAEEERRALGGESDAGEPVVLVGREAECASIGAAVEKIEAGVGSVIALSGVAGIGKTAVLDWTEQFVGDRSHITVHRATGDRFEADLPLQLVRELFTAIEDVAPAIAKALSQTAAQAEGPESKTDWSRLAATNDLIDLIRAHAVRPTVVLVDDVHWADNSSLRVLRHLGRLSMHLPILMVVAGRSGAVDGWEQHFVSGRSRHLHLAELDERASLSLAEAVLGGDVDDQVAEAVSHLGGTPLLIVDLARRLRAGGELIRGAGRGASDCRLAEPRSSGLMSARIEGLSTDVVEVCGAVWVLGRHASIDRIAAVLDRRPLEIVRLFETAAAAGVLKPTGPQIAFVHDTVGEAVESTMTGPQRSLFHRRAAVALATSGAPVTSVAAHAALASAGSTDHDLIGWLREAADKTAALEPVTALGFLDRALALTTDISSRLSIQRARVEALTFAGRVPEAMELLQTIIAMAPDQRAQFSIRLAGLQLLANQPDAAERTIENAIAANPEPVVQGRLYAVASMAAVRQLKLESAKTMVEAALEFGRDAEDLPTRSIACGMLGRLCSFDYRLPEGLRHARMAVEYAEADATGEAHAYQPWSMLAMAALDIDAHDDVERATTEGARWARKLHTPWSLPIYQALEASLAYRRGDLDQVELICARIVASQAEVGVGPVDPWAYAFLSLIASRRGDDAISARFAAQAVAAEQGASSPLGNDFVLLASAFARASKGDLDASVDHLRSGWDLFDAIEVRTCLPVLAPALTRLALAAGRRDALLGVAAECQRVADATDLLSYRALSSRVAGLINGDIEAVQKAVDLYRRTERRLDLEDTLVELQALRAGEGMVVSLNSS